MKELIIRCGRLEKRMVIDTRHTELEILAAVDTIDVARLGKVLSVKTGSIDTGEVILG